MKKNKNITIVVASDNHYSILIAALLKSIEFNHKTSEHIDFYIIDDGILPRVRKKIQKIVNPSLISLFWVKSKDVIPKDVIIPVDSSSFPRTTYLRIFAPYMVGIEVEKLIYLDVDTIVQDDISNLWNNPLGNYTIAAIQDVGKTVDCEWGGIPNYKELGLTNDTKYFNAGVLVINTIKWKEDNISKKIIDTLTKYKKHVRLVDQYGFNVVFANKWLELDAKWNWFAFKESINPSIIHFLDIKPIFKTYNSQEIYKDEFFKYLSMTPWNKFKPISGNHRLIRKIFNKIKNILNI